MSESEAVNRTNEDEPVHSIDWRIVTVTTVITIGALFGMQEWYRTYSVVSIGELDGSVGEQVAALEAKHVEDLSTGRMPIERAMQVLAEGGRPDELRPEASTDMGPAAGWMHHPDYEAPPAPGEEEESGAPPEETEVPVEEADTGPVEQPAGGARVPADPPAEPMDAAPTTGDEPARPNPTKQAPTQPAAAGGAEAETPSAAQPAAPNP